MGRAKPQTQAEPAIDGLQAVVVLWGQPRVQPDGDEYARVVSALPPLSLARIRRIAAPASPCYLYQQMEEGRGAHPLAIEGEAAADRNTLHCLFAAARLCLLPSL